MTVSTKKWVGQKHILHWFWARTTDDLLAERTLQNDDILVEWCWQNNCEIEQEWVKCPDKDTFILFGLTWDNRYG